MIRTAIEVEGWNAEAAIGFALAAQRYASEVTLSTDRESVNGKDDVEVLTLNPGPGEEVLLEVEGKDEKDAFKALLARLLLVIETPKDRLAAVTGPVTESRTRAPRRRTAELVPLDAVEEVAPVRLRRKTKRKKASRRRTRKTGQKKLKQRRTRKK